MFPIAFSAGSIVGPHAARRRHRRDFRHLSIDRRTERTRQHQRHVTKGAQGVLGAHVVAFNPRTGKLVGGFSLNATASLRDRRARAGAARASCRAARRRGHRELLRPDAGLDANFRAKFHDRSWSSCRAGAAPNDIEYASVEPEDGSPRVVNGRIACWRLARLLLAPRRASHRSGSERPAARRAPSRSPAAACGARGPRPADERPR